MKKAVVLLVGLLVGTFMFSTLANTSLANGVSPKPKKVTLAMLEKEMAKFERNLKAEMTRLKKEIATPKSNQGTAEGEFEKLKAEDKRLDQEIKKINVKLDRQANYIIAIGIISVIALLLTLAALLFRKSGT